MKRVIGPLLVGIGVFLLALAILIPTYVVPQLEKAPLDEYGKSVAVGPGTYLNTQTYAFVPQDTVVITRIAKGRVKASGSKVAVYDYTQTTQPEQMTQPLNVIAERVRFDRHTAKGVGGVGDTPDHKGALVVKFPFNTQKKTYLLHEPTALKAFPTFYAGEAKVRGLTVYRFRGPIPETVIGSSEVPGSLLGLRVPAVKVDQLYSNADRVVYVEPRTGIVIDATSQPRRFIRPTGTTGAGVTVLQANVRYDSRTVRDNVKKAKDAKSQLTLIGLTVPLVSAFLGLILILLGIWLLVRNARRVEPVERQVPAGTTTY